MNKIKIKVITPEVIEVFSPDGISCGTLNEIEFFRFKVPN